MGRSRFSSKVSLDKGIDSYSTQQLGPRQLLVDTDKTDGVAARNVSKRLERVFLKTERILADILAVLVAAGLAWYLRFSVGPIASLFPAKISLSFGAAVLPVMLGVPVLICILAALDQYNVTREMKILDTLPRTAAAVNLFVLLLLVIAATQDTAEAHVGFLVIFMVVCILCMVVSRTLTKVALKVFHIPDVVVRNTVILGAGDVGKAVARKLAAHKEYGLRPVGFIDDDPLHSDFSEDGINGMKVLGGKQDLARIVRDYNVEKLIIAFSVDSHEELLDLTSECNQLGVPCGIVPRLFEVVTNENKVHEVGGIPLMTARSFELTGFKAFLKSCEDYILGCIIFILALPILFVTAIAIKLDSRGPVLFKQKRTGRNGKTFYFYKFRSMVDGAEDMMDEVSEYNESGGPLFKMKQDPRITRVGKFIRRTSIDELPQIINVMRGEMSLVGPRPLPADAEERLKWQSQRLKMQPGITGLWQVSGRSNLPYDEMVKLDLYYIENWSLWLDLKIILKTLPALLAGKGAF